MTAKKKIIAGVGGLTAIGATVALTAGTFSYFSDSKTVNGGSADVQVGKLTLELQEGAVADQPITVTSAKPGDVLWDKPVSFHNSGDIAGELRIGFTEDTPASSTFNKYVRIQLAGVDGFDSNKSYTLTDAMNMTAGGEHLYTLYPENPTPAPGEDDNSTKGIHMKVFIDPQAGNDLQGAKGSFQLKADLLQANSDGGGRGDADGQDQSFPAKSASQP